MNQETKLVLGIHQIENLLTLLQGNDYQKHLYYHLISVQVELQRQLTNLNHSSKIKE